MCRDLALIEQDIVRRIDPGGDHAGSHFPGIMTQFFRVLPDGDRMHVDHAVDAFIVVLEAGEITDRTEIVPEMQITGRLNAREYTLHCDVTVC